MPSKGVNQPSLLGELASHVAPHVELVPQHLLNAYEWPQGGAARAVLRGDPILHFAGCSYDSRSLWVLETSHVGPRRVTLKASRSHLRLHVSHF